MKKEQIMSLKDIDKPIDERLEPIKDLEFTIDDEMKETIFEMLAIQQMLENEELSKRERKLLEKCKKELFDSFKNDLQQLNPSQIAIVRAFLGGKKNERDEN